MKYRILIVITPEFNPNAGGVQMTTYRMACAFSRLGHTVAVFAFGGDGNFPQDFGVVYSPSEVREYGSNDNFNALTHTLEQFGPDIVINQMPYEHEIGRVLREYNPRLLLGCLRNSLYSVKNNIEQYGKRTLPEVLFPLLKTRFGRYMLQQFHRVKHRKDLKLILATYDVFVMYAPPNLDELRYFVREIDADQVRLVPNSIPAVLDRVPSKEKRILWLGRLDYEQKRADLILPLWERISQLLPDWHLDIVGDGPALNDLRSEIEAKGIERVTAVGQQKPDDFYKRASIFVLTSAFEGFGNVLIEAQSFAAVPVLFDSFPNAKWIVKDGDSGYLIAPFDLTAMADRVVAIAEDEKINTLMARALENARRFHIDTVGQAWQQLFDDCIKSESRHHC